MNKDISVMAATVAALALSAAAGAQEVHNWRASDGSVWKNGSNELCWRDSSWTPATAAKGCDGALLPPVKVIPVAAPAPKPVAAPAPAPVTKAAPVVKPAPVKLTYLAEAFFDLNRAVLKPEGKAQLDDLVRKLQDVDAEAFVATGHTDASGDAAYNQRLSERRSAAVKAYLVSKGIDSNRVYTEGKGETAPAASNSTRSGRAKNRRVDVEVVGTRR